MPFDPHNAAPRPYMREGTAALAALVATSPARDVLTAIAAELSHRDRKAARILAEQVAALLSVDPPAPMDGEHGKRRRVLDTPPAPDHLWPEPRPLVLDTAANALVEAKIVAIAGEPAPKPARKPASKRADKRPGEVGWKPPSLEALIKRVGNPSHMWTSEVAGVFGNPIKAARVEALKAEGWQHIGDDAQGYMVMQLGDARLRIGYHGMIYCGDATWVQLAKEERDRLTDAGRPILARLAAEAAKPARRRKALQGLPHVRRHALDYCRKWRAMQGTDKAKWYPVEGRKSALITAWAKRREMMAKAAAA